MFLDRILYVLKGILLCWLWPCDESEDVLSEIEVGKLCELRFGTHDELSGFMNSRGEVSKGMEAMVLTRLFRNFEGNTSWR